MDPMVVITYASLVGGAVGGVCLAYLSEGIKEHDVVRWSKAPMVSSLDELASYADRYPVRIKGTPHFNRDKVFFLEIQPEQSLICFLPYNLPYNKPFTGVLERIIDAEDNNREVIVGGHFIRRGEKRILDVCYVQDGDYSFGDRYCVLKKPEWIAQRAA